MRPLILISAAIFFAGLGLGQAVRDASACSAPACRPAWSAPPQGGAVPSNAPAIVVTRGSPPSNVALSPVLRNADGEAIEARVDGIFVRPSAPLPLGRVTLTYVEVCDAGDGGADRTVSFDVTEPAPAPTRLGSVTTTVARMPVHVPSSAGGCYEKLDAVAATLSIAMDPELEPYRSVLQVTTRVDGVVWASSAWGRSGAHPEWPYPGMLEAARVPTLVFAACGPTPRGAWDRGVARGRHVVEVEATIAGGATLTAAPFEVELFCGPDDSVEDAGIDANHDADDGDADLDARSGETGAHDDSDRGPGGERGGGSGDASATPPPREPRAEAGPEQVSGCAMGASGGELVGLLLGGVGLATVVRRRRTRRVERG